jgi:hypothetical protein
VTDWEILHRVIAREVETDSAAPGYGLLHTIVL